MGFKDCLKMMKVRPRKQRTQRFRRCPALRNQKPGSRMAADERHVEDEVPRRVSAMVRENYKRTRIESP